jgi:hypothetical protein
MEEDCTWLDVVAFPPTGDTEPPVDNVEFMVYSGWNMVGLPLNVENSSYENLFPNSVSNTLFSFNGQYIAEENLIPGTGYWIRITEDGNITISGSAITDLPISLMEGWNLISGISTPVNVQNIIDPDAIIISGTIYGFEDGYVEAESIHPGHGYWLRSSGDGEITLSASVTSNRVSYFEVAGHLNRLTFNSASLYFGEDISEENMLSYSLPPRPPLGAMDIRFSGDTRLCSKEDCVIEITNPFEMINLYYEVKSLNGQPEWILVNKKTDDEYVLDGTGVIKIVGDASVLKLMKISSSTVPEEFLLHPAYPNPFNPTTTIRFNVGTTSALSQVQIYDINGRLVETLADEVLELGQHTVQWNATAFSSGVYFVRMASEAFSESQKILLLK